METIDKSMQLQNEDMPVDESSTEQNVAEDENDDGTPILDEEDLEENEISEDEVEDIEWEEPDTADAAEDEKDITD